ncbi:MAG: SDR family oxidoreductase [archaeon]|nr:SDR family oxidoreductase [archaeon]
MINEKLKQNQPFKDKFSIICGGSKGIGKEIAKLIAELGGNVCIIARDQSYLDKAAEEINNIKKNDSQFVVNIACDTTDEMKLKPLLNGMIEKYGVPDYLINNVGYAYPQYIENLKFEDFKKNMDVNYYGQLVPTLIMLPHFMKEESGYISFVSSMLGYMGIMGYATYSPSKFALIGLAEVLRNELKPFNIRISILFPPDTQTPGLDKENEIKPKECAIMSETAGLKTSKEVAEEYVLGLLKNKYGIFPGRMNKIIYRLKRFMPKLVFGFIDSDYKKARKKLGKTTKI